MAALNADQIEGEKVEDPKDGDAKVEDPKDGGAKVENPKDGGAKDVGVKDKGQKDEGSTDEEDTEEEYAEDNDVAAERKLVNELSKDDYKYYNLVLKGMSKSYQNFHAVKELSLGEHYLLHLHSNVHK